MNKIRKLHTKKRVALVAHDNKKKDLVEWAIYNKTVLSHHELIATGTTGKFRLLDGLGASGKGAHAPGETIDLKEFPILIQRAAIFIYRLTR